MDPVPVGQAQIWKVSIYAKVLRQPLIHQVKVPKFLAEKIAQADRDGIPLGTMLIDANENITLQLEDRDGVEDAIPQNYKIKITNENVKNEYIFTESGDKVSAVRGRVAHEAIAMPVIDDDYRRIMKTRNQQSQSSSRSTQRINDREGRKAAFVSGRVDPKSKDSFSMLKKKSGLLDKKERMPKADLLDLLFTAFEDKPYWQFKALADHTRQPHAWLKEVLNDICILNKAEPVLQDYWGLSGSTFFFSRPHSEMAKGLRSKSLRKHKAVRRAEIYEPVETARIHRLAAKTTQGMSIDTLASVTADSSAEKESGNMEIDGNSSTMSKMERARLLLSKNQFKKLVLRQKKEKIRKTGRKV
ncbi:MAG: hypothetical protein SGCHY_001385 [Lobulomycetales sp.]